MRLLFFVLFFNLTLIALSQDNNVEFGDVSLEEVKQTEHHLEKDAEAAILFKKEHLYYDYTSGTGWKTTRQIHYRVKIYKKSGMNWGTLKVPLYVGNSERQDISSVKGITYNLVGDEVVKSKLKRDGIFEKEIDKNNVEVAITMPEVKEGSVLDIEYKIISELYWHMDNFTFQYGIPVNKIDMEVAIPQYFIFKKYGRGFIPMNMEQFRRKKNLQVSYREKEDQFGGARTVMRQGKLEYFENVSRLIANNIPSLKKVDYTDNINNYRSSLSFELASTQFPNKPFKDYTVSWENVVETIYKYDDFGGEINKIKPFKEDLDAIIANENEGHNLSKAIFEHVKNSITWDGYYGVGCRNGFKKTYAEKFGNVADINLMLTAMLRYAGFKANPVLVSTKSHGIPLFPTTDGFNYVIVAIEENGTTQLLDATERMSAPNVLPNRAINWKGRLIRKDGTSKEIDLIPSELSKHTIFVHANLREDGSVDGKIRKQFTNQFAFAYRKMHKNYDLEEIMNQMEDQFFELEVEELKITNQNDCDKQLLTSYAFKIEKQAEVISQKIYFKPALFLAKTENPFKLDKREFPVDYIFPQSFKVNVNYKLPDGFQIESIPDNIALGLPDDMGSFNYVIKQSNGILQFICEMEINNAIIPANYYSHLKEFYNQVATKQMEKVVLSKI